MHHYKFFALVAMLLCGSSFASDVYFVCDTAKGTIKLDENKGVLRYTLSKTAKLNLIMNRKVVIIQDLNTTITHDFKPIISMYRL